MPVLFSYGTLQHPDVQLRIFGRQLHSWADSLQGYAPATVGPHANIVFTGDSTQRIPGIALEVTADDLAAADGYERPFDYRRIAVTLTSAREAWVYVHSPDLT
jgi:hypothetical protein